VQILDYCVYFGIVVFLERQWTIRDALSEHKVSAPWKYVGHEGKETFLKSASPFQLSMNNCYFLKFYNNPRKRGKYSN